MLESSSWHELAEIALSDGRLAKMTERAFSHVFAFADGCRSSQKSRSRRISRQIVWGNLPVRRAAWKSTRVAAGKSDGITQYLPWRLHVRLLRGLEVLSDGRELLLRNGRWS